MPVLHNCVPINASYIIAVCLRGKLKALMQTYLRLRFSPGVGSLTHYT